MNEEKLPIVPQKLIKTLSNIDLTIPSGGKILPVSWLENGELNNSQIWLYKIEEIAFDDEYPHREAFENVIQSMMDLSGYNLVYILEGNNKGISLYLGIVWNKKNTDQNARTNAENLIGSFLGNFNGSKVSKIKDIDEINRIISAKYEEAGIITGIPSVNEDSQDIDFQGIDRLINSMLGLNWRFVVVCEAVERNEILKQQELVYELYRQLNLFKNVQIQKTTTNSDKTADNEREVSGEETEDAHKESKLRQDTDNNNNGGDEHRVEHEKIKSSENDKRVSQTKKQTKEKNKESVTQDDLKASYNFEFIDKRLLEIMKYIDDDFLPRLKVGASKGMFKTSLYYMAEYPQYADKLRNNIISLFQGNKVTYSPLKARDIKNEISTLNIINTFQNYSARLEVNEYDLSLVLSGRPYNQTELGLCTYLTTQEISIIAGLPQKEVPGIALKSAISFGLNETQKNKDKEYIEIGNLVQKGRELEIPFYLDKNSFSKHVFIAGTTGSGKTTTCHTLIKKADMPFLVIEPAKTEYRCLINQKGSDIVIFTLGNEQVAPFRLNPFELIPGEVISGHVDMIKATFTSAFPMEASMPQILEEAIYKCYEKKGWNIYTNENELYENPFCPEVNSFPIMSDLIAELGEVVNSKGFDARLKNDYTGSLVSRLSNLTIGSKGAMLNCSHSTDFEFVATHNVIMELEGLRSQEDKSLMMGFILSRLSSQIRKLHDEYRKDGKEYRHLTLVEEAHRLLSKVEPGDSGAKKTAVETFSDLLAEVRKYGEGLIIIDQIPNKLSPEVLKNTNTKIIHKLFSQDDKDAVGNTMLMDDDQRKYISALPTGQSIVFTETTAKPVHIQVKQLVKTDGKDPEDNEVKAHFDKIKKDLGKCYDIPELMQFVQTDFSKVVADLSKQNISEESHKRIMTKVKSLAVKNNITEEDVWNRLLVAYDSVCGKAMRSSDTTETRMKDMKEFFKIYRDNFKIITKEFLSTENNFSTKPTFFLGK